MVCCSKEVSCAYQEVSWGKNSSRRSIVEDWLDTLVEIKPLFWLLRIITSHSCSKMWRSLYKVVEYARWWKEWSTIQGCISHYLHQRSHRKMSTWISFLVYLEHSKGMILCLWWLIDFQRWHISFPVRRLVMLFTLSNYFSKNL